MVVILIVIVDINRLHCVLFHFIMRSKSNYSILICDFIFIIIILTPHFVSRNVLNRFYLYQCHDENLSDYREPLTIKLVCTD